jgi:hypothetical protein
MLTVFPSPLMVGSESELFFGFRSIKMFRILIRIRNTVVESYIFDARLYKCKTNTRHIV